MIKKTCLGIEFWNVDLKVFWGENSFLFVAAFFFSQRSFYPFWVYFWSALHFFFVNFSEFLQQKGLIFLFLVRKRKVFGLLKASLWLFFGTFLCWMFFTVGSGFYLGGVKLFFFSGYIGCFIPVYVFFLDLYGGSAGVSIIVYFSE